MGRTAALHRRVETRLPWLGQLVRFCLVGATGLAVDTAVLALFTESVRIDPRAAAVPAFAVAVIWTYTMNRRWTFRSAAGRRVGFSFPVFVGVCAGGLGVRLVTMHLLMVYAGLAAGRRYYVASLGGIAVATLWNFLGSKFVAFRAPRGSAKEAGRSS
jgi:dolichol-phosphate mannosyltransferase